MVQWFPSEPAQERSRASNELPEQGDIKNFSWQSCLFSPGTILATLTIRHQPKLLLHFIVFNQSKAWLNDSRVWTPKDHQETRSDVKAERVFLIMIKSGSLVHRMQWWSRAFTGRRASVGWGSARRIVTVSGSAPLDSVPVLA